MFFAITAISSALISTMQHIFPSFSHVTSPSLSPADMPALSLSDFGSTICPLSSTLNSDSTRQQLPVTTSSGVQHTSAFVRFSFFAILHLRIDCNPPYYQRLLITLIIMTLLIYMSRKYLEKYSNYDKKYVHS